MKPIPRDVGLIQCTIERDKSGLNKVWPKYNLRMSSGSTNLMLIATKLKSKTPHYRIEMSDSRKKNNEEAGYLGRLRSNLNGNMYYIFDNGLKEEDYIKCVKNSTGGTRRRQFGSILYDSDSFKKKDSR